MAHYTTAGFRRKRRTRAVVLIAAMLAVLTVGIVGGAALAQQFDDSASPRSQQGMAGDSPATGSEPGGGPLSDGSSTGGGGADGGAATTADLGDGPITEPGAPGEVNPQLMVRFDAARAAAADAGIDLVINSGARTVEEQKQLLDEAIDEHGSLEAAKAYVAPPEKSAHVRGLALDIGPFEGAAWMQDNAYKFGLCQIYDNEPWHFEPVIAPGGECPKLISSAEVLWDK